MKDDGFDHTSYEAVASGLHEARRLLRRGWRADDDRYKHTDVTSMVWFAEAELKVRLRGTGVLEECFRSVLEQVLARAPVIRVALKGPRGGGKTHFAALLAAVLWRFYGFDVQALGGSLDQSKRFYRHFKRFVAGSAILHRWAKSPPTATLAESLAGSTVEIHPASQKSVRGPHPCGPSGGGALVLDEVALMDDAIVDAAAGQLGTANPSLLLMLSTMGEEETGRWWEMIEADDHLGFTLYKWDAFSVVAGCPFDCETTCPVPEHFANDFYREVGAGKKIMVHKAYCGGRAHDSTGWLSIHELAAFWRIVPLSTFEREYMGKGGSKVGKYFDPLLVNVCVVKDVWCAKGNDHVAHRRRFLALQKAVGIDWGYGSMAVAVFVVRIRHLVVPYRWLEWDHVPFSVIRDEVRALCWAENVATVLPDSEDPSSNEEMRNEFGRDWAALPDATRDETVQPYVDSVVFSKVKRYGYGEVVRRIEKELIVFPQAFGGVEVENHERAVKWMRALKKRSDGLPEKKNDHYPDALMCALLNFSPDRQAEPNIG